VAELPIEARPSAEERLTLAERVARIHDRNTALLRRLDESEKRFRRISRGVLRLQEEERGRLSRDLHDGVGQLLTALKIQLELTEKEADAAAPELSPRLAAAREMAERCLADVRVLSRMLRPPMLDELGIVPTLRWLARTFHEQTSIAVRLHVEGTERRLSPHLETLVYRLTQEALTNVARHAAAREASVTLRLEGERVLVRVEDGGRGFDAAAVLGDEGEAGFGVRSMRDRVVFVGGKFTLRSVPGCGTVIEAELHDREEEP
jgi:two-component system sensor histidine kinase UhpB